MFWRKFSRDKKGVTAIEYALVGPIFFLMIIGTFEYSLYFLKKNIVSHVLYEASRNVQTGEVQKSANPLTTFQAMYCAERVVLVDCLDIQFDVRSFSDVDAVTFPPATFDDDGIADNFTFEPGGPSEITAMRAAVPHNFITPMMQRYFQPDGNPAIIVGYAIAKNEPFNTVGSGT